jgi:hypothetical protein
MKRQVMGREVVVTSTKGKLDRATRENRFSTVNSTVAAASACW